MKNDSEPSGVEIAFVVTTLITLIIGANYLFGSQIDAKASSIVSEKAFRAILVGVFISSIFFGIRNAKKAE